MRISWTNEEDRPGQFELHAANVRRSLKGRKGQAALRELEAALLALPVKRLIDGAVEHDGDVCAIGALARAKGVDVEPEDEWSDPEDTDMVPIGEECGMPRLVAWEVVCQNDLHMEWLTPEQRYDSMLRWVRKQLEEKTV